MDGLSGGLQEGLQRLGIQAVPFLLAVVVHEFGHGLVAYLWGDHTAKESGRLTLNPIPHIDPIGTLLFPAITMLTGMSFMFGWAKPVPIDPRRFKSYRQGLFWVSLAGAGANFIMAVFCAILLCLIIKFAGPDFVFYKEFLSMMVTGVFINISLGIFNLLPLPPLDGSKVVESFLSYSAMQKFEKLTQYSFIILMVLMMSGGLRFLQAPIMFLGSLILGVVSSVMNVPLGGI